MRKKYVEPEISLVSFQAEENLMTLSADPDVGLINESVVFSYGLIDDDRYGRAQ